MSGDQAWSRDRESRDRGDRPNHVTKLWSGLSQISLTNFLAIF
jgi:hypothetical protein